MNVKLFLCAALAVLVTGCGVKGTGANQQSPAERGKYLVKVAGCNDCHTHDYILKAGDVPENEWLKGDTLGWNGPWGTTYAPNLRIKMQSLTEDQWLQFAAAAQLRPPMPWYALRQMAPDDLRAIYRFIRTLDPVGEPAPPALAPGAEPPMPYFKLVVPEGPPPAT